MRRATTPIRRRIRNTSPNAWQSPAATNHWRGEKDSAKLFRVADNTFVKRTPQVWLLAVLALLFSLAPAGEFEHVREVYADGRVREFTRIDTDGVVPRQEIAPSSPSGNGPCGYERTYLVRVLETAGSSVPTATLSTQPTSLECPPALLARLDQVFAPPAQEGLAGVVENRGPPPRRSPSPSPSLRAPPHA